VLVWNRVSSKALDNSEGSQTACFQDLSFFESRDGTGGKTLIVTFHSYKGGTGKTLLSVNLAILFAKMGKRVCILDLDFRAPSLHSIFNNASNYWVNDYLNKACVIEKVLTEYSIKDAPNGKLLVGLANPSTEAIRAMEAKSRTWEIEALGRLCSLKTTLSDPHFDYVFLDISPGLNYSSINAIICADVVLVVTSTDKSDVEGTRRMITDLYELFDKKTRIIINRVPSEYISSKNYNGSVKMIETYQLPVAGIVSCSCEVLEASGRCFFVCEKPDHPFTEKLREIAANLERLRTACEKSKMTVFGLATEMSPSVD
jgi:MinD-like ATPase involved in chromosome partitioning or flagellar assembly